MRKEQREKHRLLVVTPVMPPAPGGGSIYTASLCRALIAQDLVERVVVITEKHPETPATEQSEGGRCRIERVFPFRAGASKKGLRAYFNYVAQNQRFGVIREAIDREGAGVALIHSSLHNNPNLLHRQVHRLRRTSSVALIADVRDPRLPEAHFSQLYDYDAVIACSESVVSHLKKDARIAEKLRLIPVPIHVEVPSRAEIDEVLRQFGLGHKRYLLSTNGFTKVKGLVETLNVARRLKERHPGIELVVAGRRRQWDAEVAELCAAGIVRYAGILKHRTVLCLSAGALANINLSRVEGMPRTTLETLAVGGSALVSRGIPEFDDADSAIVVDPTDTEAVMDAVAELRAGKRVPTYDITRHFMPNVVSRYATLFDEATAAARHRYG